jgi:hypothetical protein
MGDDGMAVCGNRAKQAAGFGIETLPREISSMSARAVCWSNRQDDLKLRPAGTRRRVSRVLLGYIQT